jgi:hypothetical protein
VQRQLPPLELVTISVQRKEVGGSRLTFHLSEGRSTGQAVKKRDDW